MNTIRGATIADAARIAAVHVTSWRETYTGTLPDAVMANNTLERRTLLWERVLRDGARYVFVAVDDADEVVGFISGGTMPAVIRGRAPIPSHDAYVDALYVLAAAHGTGTGRALLGTLALRLRERGFHALALHVVAGNPAVRFYEHLGATFIHDEPLAAGVDEGVQSAYGWADLAVSAPAIASASSRRNDDASITIPKL